MKSVEKIHYGYGWEKSYLAVRGMATSPKRLQERLGDAYVFNLTHIRAENVTPDVWLRLQHVEQALTHVPAKGSEGTVAATTAVMNDDEALQLAIEIVNIADQIAADYREDD